MGLHNNDNKMTTTKTNELVDLQILPSEVITAFSSKSHSDFLQAGLVKTHMNLALSPLPQLWLGV